MVCHRKKLSPSVKKAEPCLEREMSGSCTNMEGRLLNKQAELVYHNLFWVLRLKFCGLFDAVSLHPWEHPVKTNMLKMRVFC